MKDDVRKLEMFEAKDGELFKNESDAIAHNISLSNIEATHTEVLEDLNKLILKLESLGIKEHLIGAQEQEKQSLYALLQVLKEILPQVKSKNEDIGGSYTTYYNSY